MIEFDAPTTVGNEAETPHVEPAGLVASDSGAEAVTGAVADDAKWLALNRAINLVRFRF